MLDRGKISPRQAMMLLTLHLGSDSTYYMPAFVTFLAGRDAWLSFAGVTGLGVLYLWATIALARRFPGQSLVQFSRTLGGRGLGTIIALLFAGYHLIVTAYICFEFSNPLVIMLLPNTPNSVMIAGLLLLAAYTVRNGIEVTARVSVFIWPTYLAVLVLTLLLAVGNMDFRQLFPVMADGPGPVLKAMMGPFPWFAQANALLMFFPAINRGRGLTRTLLLAPVVAGICLMMTAMAAVAVLGAPHTANLTYPLHTVARLISLAKVFERPESVLLFFWIGADFVHAAVALYAGSTALSEVLGLRDYRQMVFPLCFLLLPLAAQQFRSSMDLHTFAGTTFNLYAWAWHGGLLLTLWVLTWWRGSRTATTRLA